MPPSPLVNSLIKVREFSLNKLLSTSSSEVLNPIPANGKLYQPNELVVEIKQALNGFKAAAIDPSGYHVDYAALRQSPAYQDYLKSILPKLNSLDVTELRDPNTALAFWINLYNALVIHAVISYDVQASLMENGILNFYRFFRRAAYQINGQRFSLEDIEHGVIRANRGVPYMLTPQFPSADLRMSYVLKPLDPRIHFALNCASNSWDTADLTPMARSFYAENKRVANDRIKSELGVQLKFPDYRRGLDSLIR